MNVSFADFTFCADTRQLFRAGVEIHLSPKAFELLALLLNARPKALSKAELTNLLWPATFVTDASLSVLMAEIRAALGDRPRQPQFIRTVPRYGYAFSAETIDSRRPSATASSNRTCWLIAGTDRTPLARGASVVGRDPHAEVWLDLSGVSRQHARIVIDDEHATITDLESKNGTYVRGERITRTTHLQNGDEIRLGPAAFTFRILSPHTATETVGQGITVGQRQLL